MAFKVGLNRAQSFIFNFDDMVPSDSTVRVIDAFVDSIDLASLNFKFTSSSRGNRSYNPSDLLKIFLFGYHQGIRSSRKLMYQTQYNIEYKWLVNGLTPDFRTISDFRKDNVDSLKSVMFEFNLSCKELGIISNKGSQDGTKVKAVNSKENNFTLSKIDDRKKRIQEHIDEYLQLYDKTDDEEEKLNIQSNIDDANMRIDTLNSYEKKILENNSNQLSLTDPESKLMKDNGKFTVAYNNQVLVDVKSHIIQNFELTSNPADLGSMNSICSEVKDVYDFDTYTNLTDKGYNDRNDMMNCLLDGIIPEVTPLSKTDDTFNLETSFVDCKISDDMLNSNDSDDIKKCLQSGHIPNVYKDSISSIEVKEVTTYESLDCNSDSNYNDDELRDYAMENKCFTRNINTKKVFCPMGEILRKKSNNKDGIRYCNKLACKNCKNPCCNSEFKVATFAENQIVSYPKNSTSSDKKKRSKRKKVVIKKVLITFKVHRNLLSLRMQTSEHPHASMKFWDNSRYLLLKGKRKATGELALYYCAYNIRCAGNLLSNSELIEYFKEKKQKLQSNICIFYHFFLNFCIFSDF